MADGFDIGSVVAHVTADIKDFKQKINEAKDVTDGFKNQLSGAGEFASKLSKQSMLLAGVVAGGLVVAAKESIDAWKEQEAVMEQQVAVLKSTHHAAGLYEDDLEEQASALQKLTMFSDDAVMGAQNLLLTFTSIKGPIFQQATDTVLDMSQALGQDLKSSSIQLGKALNDPIQGVTALRRVGVSFTEQQLEQIKTMQKSGNIMGAQKLILAELSKEFGGSAVAAGKTFAGQLAILKNSFGELQETAGRMLIQALIPLVKFLTDVAQNPATTKFIEDMALKMKQFFQALAPVGEWIKNNQQLVLTFLTGLGIALGVLLVIGTITALIAALTNPLVLVAIGIAALYTAWQTNFLGIQTTTMAVFEFLKPYIMAVWQIITGYFQVQLAIIVGIVKFAMAIIHGNWTEAWQAIQDMAAGAWAGIKNIFNGALAFIRGWGGSLVSDLVRPFQDAWNKINDFVKKIKDALDFTKRHSPSVVDIVHRGVKEVNKALGNLDAPITGIQTQAAGVAASSGLSGGTIANISIDLGNAIISDEQGAMRIGEKIGDSIIKKLNANIRH